MDGLRLIQQQANQQLLKNLHFVKSIFGMVVLMKIWVLSLFISLTGT